MEDDETMRSERVSTGMSTEVPVFDQGLSIPKVVHQICLGHALPSTALANIDRMRSLNPTWEFKIYDSERAVCFIRENYGRSLLAAYNAIDERYGAARADFLRYLVLYREGGVYLDLKSCFEQPIDHVVSGDEGYILAQWRNGEGESHQGWGLHDDISYVAGGEFQQWHVIAAPGHPFLRAVLEHVVHNISRYSPRRDGTGWIGVLRTTGPIAYTAAIHPLLGSHKHKRVPDETILALSYTTLPAGHRTMFGRHYIDNGEPVIKWAGIRGLADRVYVYARGLKRRFRPR